MSGRGGAGSRVPAGCDRYAMDSRMDKLQVITGWVSVAILLTVALLARKGPLKRTGGLEDAKHTRRRPGGGGMLILQEFIEPRVAHVQQVSQERSREGDPS